MAPMTRSLNATEVPLLKPEITSPNINARAPTVPTSQAQVPLTFQVEESRTKALSRAQYELYLTQRQLMREKENRRKQDEVASDVILRRMLEENVKQTDLLRMEMQRRTESHRPSNEEWLHHQSTMQPLPGSAAPSAAPLKAYPTVSASSTTPAAAPLPSSSSSAAAPGTSYNPSMTSSSSDTRSAATVAPATASSTSSLSPPATRAKLASESARMNAVGLGIAALVAEIGLVLTVGAVALGGRNFFTFKRAAPLPSPARQTIDTTEDDVLVASPPPSTGFKTTRRRYYRTEATRILV